MLSGAALRERKLAPRRWKGTRLPVSFSQGRDSRVSSHLLPMVLSVAVLSVAEEKGALGRASSGPGQVRSRRNPAFPCTAGQLSGAFPCFTDALPVWCLQQGTGASPEV